MPHGGYHGPPKTKPKDKPRPKPPQGFQSPGYVPPEDRLKTSQGNKDYIPPAPGGTIITTTAGGGETREYLDQGGNVVNTQIIPPPDDKKDDKKTKTTTTDDDETRKNTFLSKILGVPITQLTSQDLAKVRKILEDYEKNKLNLNIAQLRSLMISNIAGAAFGKDQTFTDREGNRIDPDDVIDRGDGRLQALVDGKYVDVRRTREGVIEQLEGIDPNIMESLKKFNPEIYYPFAGSPQTSGGLVDLASLDATKFGSRTLPDGSPNPDYNPDFANQIFAARQELQRMDKNPFTGTSTRDEGLGQLAQSGGAGAGAGSGGAGGGTTTNPGDLIFRTMYRPNFTPSYTGGPEQIQLAGGFFDPVTKKPVFDPYGTANLYKFSKGGIANFKNYGY